MGEHVTTRDLEEIRESAPSDDRFEKRDDVDEDALLSVLGEAVEAIRGLVIPYAFVGGLAAILLGPPSRTNDIDFLVRPQDAPKLLAELGRRGFDTKVHDPS